MRAASAILISLLLVGLVAPAGADPILAPEAATEFEWATTEALGDTAARVVVTLLEPSLCSWSFHMAGSQGTSGGTFMFNTLANESAGRFSGARASSGRSTHAHLENVADARSPVRVEGVATVFPTGTWAAQGWTNATTPMSPGSYDYTTGGLGLKPTQAEPGKLGSFSLRIGVSCDNAFVVEAFAGSHELMLWTAGSMEGGAGAYESLVVGVEIDNHIEKVFTAPLVQSELSFKRYNEVGHAGTFTRSTPGGVTSWDLLEVAEVDIYDETGPGLHRLDLDRVGLDFFSTMSGASYGLTPMASLADLNP